MIVLGGDIGGTKTLLRLAQVNEKEHKQQDVLAEKRYISADYADLESMLKHFFKSTQKIIEPHEIASACFALAGPVVHSESNQTATVTNLPWQLDSNSIAHELGLERVKLINDFEAIAYGIDALNENNFEILQAGITNPLGNSVILGAGTGLGMCQIIRNADGYSVVPSEGGHWDFAATTVKQLELLRYMLDRHEHVSYDRLVSGNGLVNIFSFLVHRDGLSQQPMVNDILKNSDPAAAISAAIEHLPIANETIELFVELYGAIAGNLALFSLATGGVYLAGGIAPKLIPNLKSPLFLKAFNSKGRLSYLQKNIPVKVIMNPKAGLLGAVVAATN